MAQHSRLWLELLLYVEDRYPEVRQVELVVAFTQALSEVLAASARPAATLSDLVDPVAVALRTSVAYRRENPQPLSPREILDAYRAEQKGRPWTH